MLARQDLVLAIVICAALCALLLMRSWLNKPPSILDVHETLRWHGVARLKDVRRVMVFGQPPLAAIGNSHVRIEYWRVDLPPAGDVPGLAGIEIIACRTRQKNGLLMLAFHEGAYMHWQDKEPRACRFEPSLEDGQRLEDIFALARQFNAGSTPTP